MTTEMAYYEQLFHTEFNSGIDHRYLKVTPFTFPKAAPTNIIAFRTESLDVLTTEVITIADYVNLRNRPFVGVLKQDSHFSISIEVENRLAVLAHRAAGAYSLLCTQARQKHGNGCAVSHDINLYVTTDPGPSVADPAAMNPGWVAYRMRFIACPQSWLSYVQFNEAK